MTYTKTERKLRKDFAALVATSRAFIKALDAEMAKPSDRERGGRIANILNALEYSTDYADHFGLGKPLRKNWDVARPIKGGKKP